jgi:hypothetical protein
MYGIKNASCAWSSFELHLRWIHFNKLCIPTCLWVRNSLTDLGMSGERKFTSITDAVFNFYSYAYLIKIIIQGCKQLKARIASLLLVNELG